MIGDVTLNGYWTAICRGPEGEEKQKVEGHNVVTTNGKEFMASFLHSAATSATWLMRYIGVGTDSTAENASDTGLGAQVVRASGNVTYTSGQIFQVTATFATGSATGDISEYGLFSDPSGGTMLSRDTEATIAVGASDTLEVTMQLTIS